jgi:RES domain-containing protein
VELKGNTRDLYRRESCATCTEVLVNAGEFAHDYVITPVEVPDNIKVTWRPVETLPSGWNAAEPTEETRNVGKDWITELQSAVLAVPSVVIPHEYNYLVNPNHADFVKIRFLAPEPFSFDDRFGGGNRKLRRGPK